MIRLQNQRATSSSILRVASEREMSNYEKNKLAHIEEAAQKNKLEGIRLNGTRVKIDSETKIADINVGSLAFKSAVRPDDIDSSDLFFIRCELY